MRRLILLMMLAAPAAFPYASFSGWCEQGGQKVTVAGQASTTYTQQSYPNFTASGAGPSVTVYATGTTNKLTLYSDNVGTSLANPFPCTSTGQYQFFTTNTIADILFSGTGITAFTRSAIAVTDGCPTNSTCDAGYDTLTHACTAAGTGTLYLTKTWSGLSTQSLACNVYALANGIIKPASGQTVTISGSFQGTLTQHFDLSAGSSAAVSVGTASAMYAQWFGVKNDGATDNTTTLGWALASSCGHTLDFPGGTYNSGRQQIACGVTVFLEDNAFINGTLSSHSTTREGLLEFNSGSSYSSVVGSGSGSGLEWQNGVVDWSDLILANAAYISISNLRLSGNGTNAASGQHTANASGTENSSHFSMTGVWSDTSQGDGFDGTTGTSAGLCSDWQFIGNHFLNLGRNFISVAGYGCDRVRVVGNDFALGTPVVSSAVPGAYNAFVDFEADYSSATSAYSVVQANTLNAVYKNGVNYSMRSQGFRLTGNTASIQHSNQNQASCWSMVDSVDAVMDANSCQGVSGGTGTGEAGVYIAPYTAGYNYGIQVTNNVVDGVSGPCYTEIVSPTNAGVQTGTSAQFSGNEARSCGGGGFIVGGSGYGGPANLKMTDNHVYTATGAAYYFEGQGSLTFEHNTAQDYTTWGVGFGCNINFTTYGTAEIKYNTIGTGNASTPSTQLGIAIPSGCGTAPLYVAGNNFTGNYAPFGGSGYGASRVKWDATNLYGTASPTASGLSSGWGGGTVSLTGTDQTGQILIGFTSVGSTPWNVTITYGTPLPFTSKVLAGLRSVSGAAAPLSMCFIGPGTEATTGFTVDCTQPTYGGSGTTYYYLLWQIQPSGL